VVHSACGVCGQQSIENLLEKLTQRRCQHPSSHKINSTALIGLTQALRQQQTIFEHTGGIHGAALFDENAQVLDVREDVGRHNALDKLIGANIDTLSTIQNKVFGIVLSGRVSFELVQKAAMANIRYIVAMGAPTSLAIDLAKDCDICLLGFVKSSGFNCYFGEHMLQ
jgi:FdhD protein